MRGQLGGAFAQLKIRDESAQRLGKRSAPIRVDLDEILPKFSGEMSAFKVVILCRVRPRSRQRSRLHMARTLARIRRGHDSFLEEKSAHTADIPPLVGEISAVWAVSSVLLSS